MAFPASLQCLLFVVAALLPLALGSRWIYRRFWWRPALGLLLEALLVGLVGFEIAILGFLTNPQMPAAGWGERLAQAGWVGLIAFLGVLCFGPVVLLIARFFRS